MDPETGDLKKMMKKNYTKVEKDINILSGEVEFERVTMEVKDHFNFIYGKTYAKRKI